MDKLSLKPKTLGDKIVTDGITAVSHLEDQPTSRGLYMVVGGIAAQSYTSDPFRRPTSDIDVSVAKPLDFAKFTEFTKPVQDFLREKGYDVELKNCKRVFKMYVSPKEGDALILEFAKKSQERYEKERPLLERELENARVKTTEDGETSFRVASPEDIVVPKLFREVRVFGQNPNLEVHLKDVGGEVNPQYARGVIDHIAYLKGRAASAKSKEEAYLQGRVIRFLSDLFDIKVLGHVVGLNGPYTNQIMSELGRMDEWSSLKNLEQQKRKILEVTSLDLLI